MSTTRSFPKISVDLVHYSNMQPRHELVQPKDQELKSCYETALSACRKLEAKGLRIEVIKISFFQPSCFWQVRPHFLLVFWVGANRLETRNNDEVRSSFESLESNIIESARMAMLDLQKKVSSLLKTIEEKLP